MPDLTTSIAYFIAILIICYPIKIIYDRYQDKKSSKYTSIEQYTNKETLEDPTKTELTPDAGGYKNKYQRRYLLTKNEYHEYKKLKYFVDMKGLIVCPKVRLLDLIEPRRGDPKHKTLLYKIQSKHVDFVICDQNLYVKAILELDDNSHDQTDRQKRDDFVDLILKDVGYTVIRTRSVTENTLDSIT